MESDENDFEYTIARRIGVPRKDVFRAWTDPSLLSQWWGPHAIINPECQIDPKPGGKLYILMRDPEGTSYPLGGEVLDLVEPDSLIFSLDVSAYPSEWHESLTPEKPDPTAGLHVTAHFTDADEDTHLHVRVRFPSPNLREAYLRAGLAQGWEEGLDSLAALLRPILTSQPNTQS